MTAPLPPNFVSLGDAAARVVAGTASMLIRVIDLETTGFEPPAAGVCEIGWCDVVASGPDLIGAPTGWAVLGGAGMYVNPGHPIPPETSAIHHIIDSDVARASPWPEAVTDVLSPTDPPIAVLAAHNAKFERQFMTDAMTGALPFVCTYKCALRLWSEAPSHSNQALRYWRRPDGLDRAVANVAHRAYPDAYVTAFLLRDLLSEASLDKLLAWSAEPALQVRCHIGKWRGTPWREVDAGFLHWVSGRDFDEDVLFTVRHEITRRRAEVQSERLTA